MDKKLVTTALNAPRDESLKMMATLCRFAERRDGDFVSTVAAPRDRLYRRRQEYLAAAEGLKVAYWRAKRRRFDRLPAGWGWQVAQRFRKACTRAARIDYGAADLCHHVVGSRNIFICKTFIEEICKIDERMTAPPQPPISSIFGIVAVIDARALIREARAFESTTGPPRPGKNRTARSGPGCPRTPVGIRPAPLPTKFKKSAANRFLQGAGR
jgi:hypothetical protein